MHDPSKSSVFQRAAGLAVCWLGVLAAVTAGTAARADVPAPECVIRDGCGFLRWSPEDDSDAAGFFVECLDPATGQYNSITPQGVESSIGRGGRNWYEAADPGARTGVARTYRIDTLFTSGKTVKGAPFSVVPVIRQTAGPAALAVAEQVAVAGAPSPRLQAAPGDRVKVLIDREGMVGISAAAVASNLTGYTVGMVADRMAAGNFRVRCGTNEIAWLPMEGNTGILFYATSLYSPYTWWNVYWIEPSPGTWMTSAMPPDPGAAVDGLTFRQTSEVNEEYRTNHGASLDPEADNWYWVRLSVPTNTTVSTNWTSVLPWAQAGEGALRMILKGDSTEIATPPHHARIYLNGTLLGEMHWNGAAECISNFPATTWMTGTNNVRIEGFALPGETPFMRFFMNSFRATYRSLYRPVDNTLRCAAESNAVVSADGFGQGDIRVFDVTDPCRPVAVQGPGVVIDEPESNRWRVTFAPEAPDRQYWIMAGPPMEPAGLTGRPASSWNTSVRTAEYVVIYHNTLKAGAQALVEYRATNGLASLGVDVEDIYDDFADGIPTPHAIRAFLKHALAHWTRPPAMAALAGAGTFDYRNIIYDFSADPCLIPPILVRDNVPVGLVGVDMPLGDTDDDGVPDVVIGRLPVLNSNQMWEAVRKIVVAEAAASNASIASLVADVNDSSLGAAGDFMNASDQVAAGIGPGYQRERNYGSMTNSIAAVRDYFKRQLNQRRALLTYVGHANNQALGISTTAILGESDVASLTNGAPSILLGMTCLFGRSSFPYGGSTDSLSEQLVRKATGGVVAVWSCAAKSYSDDNVLLGKYVVRSCFRTNGRRLGAALKEAMILFSRDPSCRPWVLQTFALQGDPALNMAYRNGEPATYEAWMQSVFTQAQQTNSLISGPSADPDQDGSTNEEEYRGGTLPLDGGSQLEISTLSAPDGHVFRIRWPSVSNRLYQVERSTNDLRSFERLADYIGATPPENEYVDDVKAIQPPVFYRVRLME